MREFEQPGRGSAAAYDRYLQGMDASLRQKVALTAAHLLCEGSIADLGTGSGSGAHALAALYPGLEVTGVDVDPTMVERARERHILPNLRFLVGDVAEPVFQPGTQNALFDSSILHHVTSYGGYNHDNARRALAVQAAQLAEHGVLIVRDFLAPPVGEVELALPDDDGAAGDDPATCSSAALLRRFAREFRSLSAEPGFALEELAPAGSPGWARFRLSRRMAVEFLLRKDYRADWVAEVQEEYCIFDQPGFEDEFERLALRVLASTPLVNPWIVRHRFAGRYRWTDLDGRELPHPATNYIIVGERVPPGQGVRFRVGAVHEPLRYLILSTVRRTDTGQLRDLARRPHPTLDILPFFTSGSDLYVLARMSYPRALLGARPPDDPPLDGRRLPHFVTEPLTVVQRDAPIGRTIEDHLASYAGVAPTSILGVQAGTTYYPSAGGIEEEVRSALVEIQPLFANVNPGSRSGFSSSGRVGAIAAHQVLRAAQVGGLVDARLELNVYELLLRRGASPGAWIGDPIEPGALAEAPAEPLAAVLARPPRRRYVSAEASAGFLAVHAHTFEEIAADGSVVAARPFEWVTPRGLGLSTLVTLPLARAGGAIAVGLDDDDLPAAQALSGNSNLLVVPAWRLPRGLGGLDAAWSLVAARLATEHGLGLGDRWSLGGAYAPSPGLTPELVHPYAVEVRTIASDGRPLIWVPLADCIRHRASLTDGHLRIALLRAAHALGLLDT